MDGQRPIATSKAIRHVRGDVLVQKQAVHSTPLDLCGSRVDRLGQHALQGFEIG